MRAGGRAVLRHADVAARSSGRLAVTVLADEGARLAAGGGPPSGTLSWAQPARRCLTRAAAGALEFRSARLDGRKRSREMLGKPRVAPALDFARRAAA